MGKRNSSPCFGHRSASAERLSKHIETRPGPADYSVYKQIGRESPAATIGKEKRLSLPKKVFTVPGPGDYSPDHQNSLRRFPAYTMCRSASNLRQVRKSAVTPGPGDYSVKEVSSVQGTVQTTIPKGLRDLQRDLKCATPGPAQYSTSLSTN